MRKEPFGENSIIHVFNRGNRKQKIVNDEGDRWHFLQMLFYFNDKFAPTNTFRTLKELLRLDLNSRLIWPDEWSTRENLVKIIAFCLRDNHFHLILQEIKEGGVTKFMQKLGVGMTNYFNTKHKETGRLFQGSYKARLVDTDNYLKYLSVYIQVKNVLESYPGGVENALLNFNDAYQFALDYKYGSLGAQIFKNLETNKIIDNKILTDFFENDEYKNFARDCLSRVSFDESQSKLIVEIKSQQELLAVEGV